MSKLDAIAVTGLLLEGLLLLSYALFNTYTNEYPIFLPQVISFYRTFIPFFLILFLYSYAEKTKKLKNKNLVFSLALGACVALVLGKLLLFSLGSALGGVEYNPISEVSYYITYLIFTPVLLFYLFRRHLRSLKRKR